MKTARRALVVSGVLIMGYAVGGALTDTAVRAGVLVFLVAVLIAHDVLLLPLAIAAGALISRIVPPGLRSPVRVAAVISLAVTVVAVPLVLGRGRVPDNPSLLPLDYGRGLLVVYALIGTTTAVAVVVRRRRRRPHGDRDDPGSGSASRSGSVDPR
ncbi:hypothetical protein [Jidongwangia harbinensis]|uniref:hypothetical protein n=1 Tax=Jidongwangia harbinensis TaxID=2878561 RepID=UPI001CD9A038|nr:hypothetical protein [Jidongwangia harbinensis]MCA2211506.1 hypothetical protein [Jidongwangia harbinensis]